jgi:hypothetical protein
MKLQELKQTVQDSPSSIFTKDDIIKLLDKVKRESYITQELADEIRYAISNRLNQLDSDVVVDMESASFDLERDNTIVLSDISIDLSKIESIIEEVLDENVTEETTSNNN